MRIACLVNYIGQGNGRDVAQTRPPVTTLDTGQPPPPLPVNTDSRLSSDWFAVITRPSHRS